jgi:Alpha amylase, catalytic domain
MTQRGRARSWFALVVSGALAASAIAVIPGLAAAAEEPRTFALVGSLQSELGCPGDWAPDCAETELTATGTPGVYAADFTVPAGTWEYKVAVNDTWDEAYGLNGGGDNIPLTVAGDTPVRVVFDDNLKRVGLESTGIRTAYDEASDAGLVADPVRQPGSDETFYFVMTDRFVNGDATNDQGGLTGDALTTGFDPTHKGFYNGGDLAGLRSQLDYIDGLGTSAIWLTPSFKNRPVQGEGRTRAPAITVTGSPTSRRSTRTSAPTPSSRPSSPRRTTRASRSTSTSSRTTQPTSSTTPRARTPTSTRPRARTRMPRARPSTRPTTPTAASRSLRSTRPRASRTRRSSRPKTPTSRCRPGSTTRRCTTTGATRRGRASP